MVSCVKRFLTQDTSGNTIFYQPRESPEADASQSIEHDVEPNRVPTKVSLI